MPQVGIHEPGMVPTSKSTSPTSPQIAKYQTFSISHNVIGGILESTAQTCFVGCRELSAIQHLSDEIISIDD